MNDDFVTVGVELKGEIATAFKAICGDTTDSYAGFTRKAILGVLREEGYMPAPHTPRRHRGPRRTAEAAA